jgi:hypothetical protein
VECPTAQTAARAQMHTLTGVLANRGSGPWAAIGELAERVTQLVSQPGLLLGESSLSSKPKKVIQPQGTQTADGVLQNGVVFKHALRPDGVLRERDRAATQLELTTRKTKGKQNTAAITVVYIDPRRGVKAGVRSSRTAQSPCAMCSTQRASRRRRFSKNYGNFAPAQRSRRRWRRSSGGPLGRYSRPC